MLGILMLDTRFPRPLGDSGHPGSFAFEVRYQTVSGAEPQRVVRGVADHPLSAERPEADAALLQRFVEAGLQLVADGAQAVSTSCGFLARWQPQLQQALPVPVWSSALLKLPELAPARCGVITIEAASLKAAHFLGAGADPATPVEGIIPGCALHHTLLGNLPTLDTADAQAQVVAAGRRLLAREPGLQALVLECTNLPPYALALQDATGLPVHHIVSFLHERMARLPS